MKFARFILAVLVITLSFTHTPASAAPQLRQNLGIHFDGDPSIGGNVYVNRNQIGAIVGSQPFGGCGLSGTGPKAGGPSYLLRFANERTTSVNTTAVGGNASLLSLNDA